MNENIYGLCRRTAYAPEPMVIDHGPRARWFKSMHDAAAYARRNPLNVGVAVVGYSRFEYIEVVIHHLDVFEVAVVDDYGPRGLEAGEAWVRRVLDGEIEERLAHLGLRSEVRERGYGAGHRFCDQWGPTWAPPATPAA